VCDVRDTLALTLGPYAWASAANFGVWEGHDYGSGHGIDPVSSSRRDAYGEGRRPCHVDVQNLCRPNLSYKYTD